MTLSSSLHNVTVTLQHYALDIIIAHEHFSDILNVFNILFELMLVRNFIIYTITYEQSVC